MQNYVQWMVENWEAESEPKASDLWAVFAFAAVFPTLRFVLDTFLYERIGRHFIFKKAREISRTQSKTQEKSPLLKGEASKGKGDKGKGDKGKGDKGKGDKSKGGKGRTNGTTANGESPASVSSVEAIDREALEKTHIKFKESSWKALYYTSALVFAIVVMVGEPWLANPKYYFVGPGDQMWPDQTMKLKLKAMFLYIGGFYTYSIFALLFWETRRKDFGVSMVHHVVSVVLVCCAYVFKFGRPACLVVAIHDTSDIFLELAKLSKYLDVDFAATIFFVVFALSWAVLRLWCYPRYIVYASTYVAPSVLPMEAHVWDGPPLYYVFNTILILLQVLHVYWWILILRVLAKQIFSKEMADVRSEDEDDD